MEAGDDISDSASVLSLDKSVRSIRSSRPTAGPRRQTMADSRVGTESIAGSVMSKKAPSKNNKPVSKLRLKKPIIMSADM